MTRPTLTRYLYPDWLLVLYYSAYNIFFKDERAKLLAARQMNDPSAESAKIGFEAMAKTIGKRWKELTAEELSRYKELAKEDTERYRTEMDAYNYDLAMKGRKEREESSRKRMEEAGIQQDSQAIIPSLAGSDIHQQQQQRPNEGNAVGHLAGTHRLGYLSAGLLPAQLQASATANSAVSQLDQLLAEALRQPGFQGLGGTLSAAPQRRSSLHDQLFLNILQQQQPNSRLMEGQLGQSGLSHYQPLACTPAPTTRSLMASISQHEANPASQHLMASLRVQRQLIIQQMQGTSGRNASWGA
jgi:HMG (high mobility group) box